eukprot:scaffold7348_cov113-Isochrysis_galbana.AAC.2
MDPGPSAAARLRATLTACPASAIPAGGTSSSVAPSEVMSWTLRCDTSLGATKWHLYPRAAQARARLMPAQGGQARAPAVKGLRGGGWGGDGIRSARATCAARGGFDDGAPLAQRAGRLGLTDDRSGHAVLGGAARVEELRLGKHAAARLPRERAQLDHGRLADELECIASNQPTQATHACRVSQPPKP